MADSNLKKYLDQAGLEFLWKKIKAADDANATLANNAQTAANNAQTSANNAQTTADGAQADVDALEKYVGTIPETATAKDIVAYVQEKTAGIATSENLEELTNRVAQVEESKADKTALEAVSEVANAAVKQSDYDVKIKALEDEDARIAGLVTAEAERAAEEEGKLRTDLDLIKAFFEGTDFDNKEGGVYDALDSLKEIQDFLAGEGGNVDQLLDAVAKNTQDIATNAGGIADNKAAIEAEVERATNAETALANSKADKTEVETAVNGLNEVIATLATKAELTTASQNAASYTDSKFNDLSGTVNTLAQSVAANDAKYEQSHISFSNDISDLKAASHTHANKEVLDGISAEKVAAWDAAEANAKAHATNLNTAMDGRVSTIEGAYLSKDDAASTYETKTDASAKLDTAKAYTDTEVAKIQALSIAEIEAAIAAAQTPETV